MYLGFATVALIATLLVAARTQKTIERALPPRFVGKDYFESVIQRDKYVQDHPGTCRLVMGTGSMAPYIPASPAGRNPLETPVAWVVVDPRGKAAYADVKLGSLCLYRGESPRVGMIHAAYRRTGENWRMTGINSRSSDQREMTAENFLGLVTAVFTWEQK